MTETTSSADHVARLRALPAVDRVLAAAGDLVAVHGRSAVTDAVRATLDEHRAAIRAGAAPPDTPRVIADAARRLVVRSRVGPRKVLNATGVIVHTNLGRAPLSQRARAAVEAAAGACDLELDLATGGRGSRGHHVDGLLAEVTRAEAALVVNNAAGALVLVVAALAAGRGVVVSRGELVEIGGSFRLPDVLEASGARLVEVGTTNRTRADDFARGDDVALLLRMHPSNYAVVGFTASPSIAEVAAVARERGLPLVHDVGSGLVTDPAATWAAGETSLRTSLDAGADLVIASGDKLLGGPQAGLIAGREDLVATCRRHPFTRALRLDKLRLAALAATLQAHRDDPDHPDVPVRRMLDLDRVALERRAAEIAAAVPGAAVVESESVVGGGTAPGAAVAGPVVRVDVADPDGAAATLRRGEPPVMVRIAEDGLLADPRTVAPDDDAALASALARVATARKD